MPNSESVAICISIKAGSRDENTDEHDWLPGQDVDDRVAEVVCRQMGWTVGRLVELSIVPEGSNQIWM